MAATLISAYEILGVNETALIEEIKQAYYRKAKLHHPDLGGQVEDFLNMKKAYDILSEPKQRMLLGNHRAFRKPLMRIQPSTTSSLDQLLQNLDALGDQLKKAEG